MVHRAPPLEGSNEIRRLAPVIVRSSDLQAVELSYWPLLPSSSRPSASIRWSFLLTAAGQFRILTGFPWSITKRKVARLFGTPQSQTSKAVIKQPSMETMENDSGQRQMICQSCGAPFGCCAERIASCWCSTVEISDDTRAEIRKKFADCICPACLAKFAMKETAAKP